MYDVSPHRLAVGEQTFRNHSENLYHISCGFVPWRHYAILCAQLFWHLIKRSLVCIVWYASQMWIAKRIGCSYQNRYSKAFLNKVIAEPLHTHYKADYNDKTVNHHCLGPCELSLQWRHRGVLASQTIGISTVCSTGYSGQHHRNHLRAALLLLCDGNSPMIRDTERVSIAWRHPDTEKLYYSSRNMKSVAPEAGIKGRDKL